jgi:hypothetical protein
MDSRIRIELNLNKETMGIFVGRVKVGSMEFLIDETQINVVDLTIVNEKQHQGYGRILLNVIKGVASFYKIPIYLIANPDKVKYYKKNEFFSLSELSKDFTYQGKKINIKNLNLERPIEKELTADDMLWIPITLTEVDVYI